MLPRGSKVTEAIRRAAGRPARTPTHERGGGGRLSDSLIKECEQSKPPCCSTVNRIRETLVLLPPRFIPFLYCNGCRVHDSVRASASWIVSKMGADSTCARMDGWRE